MVKENSTPLLYNRIFLYENMRQITVLKYLLHNICYGIVTIKLLVDYFRRKTYKYICKNKTQRKIPNLVKSLKKYFRSYISFIWEHSPDIACLPLEPPLIKYDNYTLVILQFVIIYSNSIIMKNNKTFWRAYFNNII